LFSDNQTQEVRMSFPGSRFRVVLGLMALMLVGLGLLIADNGPNHQVRTLSFGSSGGNINDATKAFCCSGTLGSLVKDSSNAQYILSNNHVLARADQAASGEDISQPGLIDNNCQPGTIVGDFTVAPQLGSNVDAALAALRSGTMDSAGSILDVGVPHSSPLAASVGLAVAKSGRTTGLTCGSIQSTNTSVKVQYQQAATKARSSRSAIQIKLSLEAAHSARWRLRLVDRQPERCSSYCIALCWEQQYDNREPNKRSAGSDQFQALANR
jgi:hypothetical protein